MQLPYRPLEFTTEGAVAKPEQLDAAVALATGEGQQAAPTHVLCLCHGWNNTVESAERMYTTLADTIAAQQTDPAVRLAVIGLLWPSVEWADEGGTIAGGGLAVTDPADRLVARIDATQDPATATALKALVPQLAGSPDARAAFVEVLRERVLPAPAAVADDDPMPLSLLQGDAQKLFQDVQQGYLGMLARSPGLVAAGAGAAGPGTGAAAGLFGGDGLSPLVLARFLLNIGTYYTMKERSGIVGTNGVTPLLQRLATDSTASVSLVGHSFGARAISAAVAAGGPAHAVCLLQGAFSQFALDDATGPLGTAGAFRAAVAGVSGPIVVTHSQKDLVVRLAYAIASRIAQQAASALGDRNDRYGGIGANGAVGLPAGESDEARLGPVGTAYAFTPRRVHNLIGDDFIVGHGAVTGPQVADAVRQAVLA